MAGAGANEGEQAAAAAAREEPPPPIILATAANARPPPATLLDPRLFMAARRGDSKQLKDLLLLLEDDDDEDPATAVRRPPVEAEAAQQVVVVQVDSELSSAGAAPAPAPAPSPAPAPLPVVLDGGGVTMDGDSLLHVVAACGDGEEFIKCAKMIVRDKERKGGAAAKRLVLEARNSNGDTPLHCAAGAGNAEMISCLVALANTADAKAFVRIRNRCGETSLHQAIRRAASADNNADKVVVCIIDRLMSVDSKLACIPAEGEEGASPLYLAISLADLEIARHLLVKTQGRLSYSGPDGRNVLHAAVSCGRALPILLKLLEDQTKTADLVWQLTSQRDKLDGRTPLHSATAALKARPWSCLFFRLFPQFLSGSGWAVTKALLDANVSTAYQADNEGSYPVHAAAWSHCLRVVKLLLERCPDSATLRDGKGRTFLHVAVEEEFPGMVQYVCGMPQFACILNAQDKNGDTPLHRAVHAGNVAICSCLIRNRQNPRSIIEKTLAYAGAQHGSVRPQLLNEKYLSKRDVDGESEKITQATQVMSIVAVLIATVTFASAFTLPGGYRAVGTAVLAGTGGYAFDAFILADTLAFICSCLATFGLVYAGVPFMDISIRTYYCKLSAFLLQNAGRSFVVAFGLCLYLVLAPADRMVAVSVCVVIFASLLLGNMEAWNITCLAITVRAGAGIRPYALRSYAQAISLRVLVHFGSFIIIFGLPAIRKWARSAK